jgi:hypothetical protein
MQATPNAARKTVVVRASKAEIEVPRRAALALAAAVVIGLSVDAAQAVGNPKNGSSKYNTFHIDQSPSLLSGILMISLLTCFAVSSFNRCFPGWL